MDFLQKLNRVEYLAKVSKAQRFLAAPMRYAWAQFVHKLYFRLSKKGVFATAKTFFETPLSMVLPAATDIYLTGGKTHDSEIRLAKFLIRSAQNSVGETHFLDIGAHIGYYSAMMATLLGERGRVISVEAAKGTFELLQHNLEALDNAHPIHAAATETDGERLFFFEFPVLYSEYNSLEINQFVDQKWFKNFQPERVEVVGISVDTVVEKHLLAHPMIKIDVEGAEPKVVAGMKKTLANRSPIVIIEYLSEKNESHAVAKNMLEAAGYVPHWIDGDGILRGLNSVDEYFKTAGLDSDNFVFISRQL